MKLQPRGDGAATVQLLRGVGKPTLPFFVFPQNYVADCGVSLLLRPKRVEFLINVFEKLKEGKGERRWHAVGMGMGSDVV